ncbi:AMP-binding protein [Gynuella sp.]|uniref:AMP-binding protein n=1 Tax=Gynuella sp. TaxID=2969146 RepID=UPI003D129AD2
MAGSYFYDHYPAGMVGKVDPDKYSSIVDIFDNFVKKFSDKPVFSCMGQTISFDELNRLSASFASYLQNHTDLQPGDRIAVQLPNILQFPVVVWGAIRAGMVVVNTNPLYTDREMEHQFNDSGAKVLIVYAGMAAQALRVKPKTGIQKIIVTEIADLHSPFKRLLINSVVKYVKKMVPAYDRSAVVSLLSVLSEGGRKSLQPVEMKGDDLAVLQYTGGTTGVAKGAMLTHRNLVANMLQSKEFFQLALDEGKEIMIAPLPLYHIYAFLVHGMLIPYTGNHNVLIPNPRDLPAFIKEMAKYKFTSFTGLNTLFVALCNNEDFRKLDFSHLKMTVSGGMALTKGASDRWQEVTGCCINEGYGMTETSPVLSFNPPGHVQLGTIGIPAPSTEIAILDENGNALADGEAGELCARGPQVMKGYWKRPEETAKTMTEDGFIRTGDIAIKQDDGYLKIVDRKKDMIIVSGFNVYPNEVEEVLTLHPQVLEAAAIGTPDDATGEKILVFVVAKGDVTESDLIAHCRKNLTAYKVPKVFEFRPELPKTNVGKVLRRALKEELKTS